MTQHQSIEKYRAKEITLEEFFDELIENGNCPALINDDAGHWAISESGAQEVIYDEPNDLNTTFFIEKKDWKNTVREAVLHFYTNI